MPQKLTTTVPNSVNAAIIDEFYQYMRSKGLQNIIKITT
jgi:hypothetical protein